MMRCPHCQATERQVKAGKTGSGSQRIKCHQCGRRYTPQPKVHGYPDEMRLQAVKLYIEGMNFRRIGRLLGVDHKTVMWWVRAHSDGRPEQPPLPAEVEVVEEDELYTFVSQKKTKST
jgi:transposase-like protein